MNLEKYKNAAARFNIEEMLLISSKDIVFDPRTALKCRWGCSFSKVKSVKCETYGLSIEERKQIVASYHQILLLQNHDGKKMTHACLEIERELFLDGYYLASALRACNYCEDCAAMKGGVCSYPEKVRPCEQMFGIDVYKTIRGLDLPINVLKNKEETENRYGFVLID